MNEQMKQILNNSGLDIRHGGIVLAKNITGEEALEKFSELIVKHILLKIENEIELAYNQEKMWTAATLEALALEILNDFDMEISDE